MHKREIKETTGLEGSLHKLCISKISKLVKIIRYSQRVKERKCNRLSEKHSICYKTV